MTLTLKEKMNIIIENDNLEEKIDNLLKPVYRISYGIVYYSDGEVVSRQEWIRRMAEGRNILRDVRKRVSKTTFLEKINLQPKDEDND